MQPCTCGETGSGKGGGASAPGTRTGQDADSSRTATAVAGRVILIVDDEFLIRWSLRSRLQADGWRVLEAATAGEARRLFTPDAVDVVLLDVLLPDGNGFELLAEFTALGARAKVVLITAHGTDDMATRALDKGAFAFVHKPFQLHEIAALAARAVCDG